MNNLSTLSLTDLISLKRHLMSKENMERLTRNDTEEVRTITNRLVLVDAAITERVERIFENK